MTRISAVTAVFLICLTSSVARPSHAQTNSAADHGCFPWQEFRNGQCVAKPASAPPPPLPATTPAVAPPSVAPPAPPAPPPVAAGPCLDGGFRNSAGQCTCPTGTHADVASGRCVADIAVRRPETIVCDGGAVSNGSCVCPTGFRSIPTAGVAEGRRCIRTDAENCQGGELTVSGRCECNGQVTMSGEVYLLEYANGKCLPMRCPVTALLHDGKCGATSSAEPAAETENKPESKPHPAPKERRVTRDRSDEGEHRRRCGRDMVMTRLGCVPAERRLDDVYRQYYRNYQLPNEPR